MRVYEESPFQKVALRIFATHLGTEEFYIRLSRVLTAGSTGS